MLSRSPATRAGSRSKPAGFTLLELSVVLVIIAAITGVGIGMGSSMIDSASRAGTQQKMDTIEAALEAFRLANDRLPCPADARLAASSSNYGQEAANLGSCTGGAPAADATANNGNNSNIPANTTVAEGAVPVRTLGLPDQFQFDAWGRKFSYAVWTPMTNLNAFVTYGIAQNCGGITVENAGHGYRSKSGAYALISYGADGHGGYLQSGARYSAGATDSDEQTDCHCNSSATDTGYTATYVQKDMTWTSATSTFDDYVRFKERWQMQNDYDAYVPSGQTCGGLGFRIDGPVASANLSVPITGNWQVFSGIDINNDGKADLVLATWGTPMLGYVLFGTANWPSVIDLSTYALTGSNGFTISINSGNCGGQTAGPFLVGDFDGDGHNDLAMADNDCNGNVVVVFGGQASYQPTYNTLDFWCDVGGSIDGTQAACLHGDTALGSYTTWTAAGRFTTATAAGLLFAEACSGGSGTCAARYAPGKARPWAALQNLSTLSGTINFTSLPGNGTFVWLGDVNNDGYADLITADAFNPIAIVYGGAGPGGSWGSSYSFNNINTANNPSGMKIAWPSGSVSGSDQFGVSIAVGDLSGDGKNDFIIGDKDWNSSQGRTFAIYGPLPATSWAAGWDPSTKLNGTTGSTLLGGSNVNDGPDAGGMWGTAPTLLFGDLNGDGKQDLIQWNGNAFPPNVGIVFGGGGYGASYTWGSDSKSVAITGDTPTMVAVGDINGDGINDLIIGCGGSNKVYVIWGQASWPQTIDLTTLPSSQGIVINGTLGGSFGQTVAAWDVNGDGKTDLIICAPGQSNNGLAGSGSCYLLFGHTGSWAATINDTAI